jgi:hypothetical protein
MCERCYDVCRRCGEQPAVYTTAGGLMLCEGCGPRLAILRRSAHTLAGQFADQHPELGDLAAWYAGAAPFLQQ